MSWHGAQRLARSASAGSPITRPRCKRTGLDAPIHGSGSRCARATSYPTRSGRSGRGRAALAERAVRRLRLREYDRGADDLNRRLPVRRRTGRRRRADRARAQRVARRQRRSRPSICSTLSRAPVSTAGRRSLTSRTDACSPARCVDRAPSPRSSVR